MCKTSPIVYILFAPSRSVSSHNIQLFLWAILNSNSDTPTAIVTITVTNTSWPTMASPAPGEQTPSVQIGRKRKREEDKDDEAYSIDAEGAPEDEGVRRDTNDLIPDDYDIEEDYDDDDQDDTEENDASVGEDDADHPKHDESDESFPPYAIYDDAIEDIQDKLISIPQQILNLAEDCKSNSRQLKGLRDRAQKLNHLPETEKLKIAILGGAGVGKSSLLNAVTGKPDLAKSVSIQCSMSENLSGILMNS